MVSTRMVAATRAPSLLNLSGLLVICLACACGFFVAGAGAASPLAPRTNKVTASNVGYSSVVFNGFVNAHGQPTNYYFQYGATAGYGAQTPLSPGGNATTEVKVSQLVTGLQPLTTYHFRLVVINAYGVTDGYDHVFTTTKVPLSLQIAGVPNPVSFGSPFTVEGNLSGTGSANHAVVLQINPFPYTAGFKQLGNPELTGNTGGFSFPVVSLLENAQLRVQTVGPPIITSPVVLENVAVRISFHARRARHGRWRLYGDVAPAEAGALVGFQRLVPGGRTVNEGGTVVKEGTSTVSRFSRTIRLRHRGVYRALVKVNDGGHVSAYSAPVLVR